MERLHLFAAVLGSLVALTTCQDACANVSIGQVQPPLPLPQLPTTAFKTVVRAQLLNINETVEAVEYVDEANNAASMVMTQEGVTGSFIMSYATNEIFYLFPADGDVEGPYVCEVTNMSADQNRQYFGYSTSSSSGYRHVYSTSKILNFINGTEVYKGQTVIDGVPVNHWSSCQYWSILQANFTLDYYFTVPGWVTPSGLTQVPFRAEIQGMASNATNYHNFHHIYQYVNFEPYVNDPETVFQTPPGTYCLLRKNTKQMPKLSNHFYYREEYIIPATSESGLPMVSESDIWFDFDLKLTRADHRAPPLVTAVDFAGANGPFHVIHDYNTGVQYTIAEDTQQCSMDPIPTSAKLSDGIYNPTYQTLSMKSALKFFDVDDITFLYAGQRTARGIDCDVFQALMSNMDGHVSVIYEVYFMSASVGDITDRGSTDDDYSQPQAIPVRLLVWADGNLQDQYEIHDFDQDSLTVANFDVSACFPDSSSIDFEIYLTPVPKGNVMSVLAPYVQTFLLLEVATMTGGSPLRVQRSRFNWDQNTLYYQATLLDNPPPLAEFQMQNGTQMTSGTGKSVSNINNPFDCAAQCTDLQFDWNCLQFDYCPSSKVCTLGKTLSQGGNLVPNPQCNHYYRVLGNNFTTEPSLDSVWQLLKNLVYQKKVVLTLPLPDSSGYLDTSINPDTLDPSKKINFTAIGINNQVKFNGQTHRTSSSILSQFQTIPRRQGKGYDDMKKGVSIDDCATKCMGEPTFQCNSFSYCWDSGACFTSRQHPDERPDMLKHSMVCDLYIRDYTANFQQFNGITVLSGSNVIYQNIKSASQCAKLCTYYKSFHCESFDFCTDVNTCFLGNMHYYDAPKANVAQVPSCVHFSRNYVQDFVAKTHKTIPMRGDRVIQDMTPQQCAKLCVQESSFTCNSFDFCGNFSECRLTDASMSHDGQQTNLATDVCDVYNRQYSATGGLMQQAGGSSSSSSYTPGAMAGAGVALLLVGILLVVGGVFIYNKVKGGGGNLQFSNPNYSRHQDDK